eukprot:TRINITY_DN8215_c0_g1_i1.p2 TRINITY_DN8215_c0_g1~~TRINITY_DN8215_c0_g1_i1.p2  ORF type:complete len:230 (-),score=83.26 TRINITY_DN8215_c0_g1_i1:116-748(-)
MSLELIYFPFANRAGAVRDALRYGGVDFVNTHIDFKTFGEKKAAGEFPAGSVPVLVVDGVAYAQSNAQALYAAERAGLTPKDALDQLRVNELLCAVEDAQVAISPTMRIEDEKEKLAARAALIEAPEGKVYKQLALIAKRVGTNGPFAVGDSVTVADFKLRHFVNWVNNGVLDGIPKDSIKNLFPQLVTNANAINDLVKEKCGEEAVSGK